MEVRFWNAQGITTQSSISGPGASIAAVELTSQSHRLIIDAGAGIRSLGQSVVNSPPVKATMLFSHLRQEHVEGFPFFIPAFIPSTELVLYGPGADGGQKLHAVLHGLVGPPLLPIPMASMRSKMEFFSAVPGGLIEAGPFRITPFELPQDYVGYLIESQGFRFAFRPDIRMTAESVRSEQEVLSGVDALVEDMAQEARRHLAAASKPYKRAVKTAPPWAWGFTTPA